MNDKRSTPRFASTLSLAALAALWLLSAAAAAEVPLRAFTASYDLHYGSMHIANAELSLGPFEDHWRWRLTSRTRGIYTLFYDRKPYTETVFDLGQRRMRLRSIELSDEDGKDEEEYESADFDWKAGKMKVLRKGSRRQVALSADVYDYQTIHLLAAEMQLRQLDRARVKFYRKGKLVDCELVYQGKTALEYDGETVDARVYEQTMARSSTVSRYYYDARNPLVPLLVETRKEDENPTILRLRAVEWQS